MADANFAFMAKQLMQTELRGHKWTDRAGGAYAEGEKLWVVVWDAKAAGDPEKLVQEAQQRADEQSLPLAGLIVVTTPAAESEPELAALEEALYVYGYPRRQGLGSGGPDMVQLLGKPAHHKPLSGLSVSRLDGQPEALSAMLAEACTQTDGLGGPGWSGPADFSAPDVAHIAATRNGSIEGFASLTGVGVSGRVALLWVRPESRGQGIGGHLLEAAAKHSNESGQFALSAWTHRDGRLRYYFAQEGYNDQLRLFYFQPEGA